MITRKFFTAHVVRANGAPVNVPVQIELAYDDVSDPFAVRAVFYDNGQEIVWHFSRDLLKEAVESRGPIAIIGAGDVKFQGQGQMIAMCLGGVEGHADVLLPRQAVASFVSEVDALTGQIAEDVDSAIDDFLEEVLGE